MSSLQGKNILLGISGGIAAYKCAELTRRLSERGATIKVVMTTAAKEFITPLTMQAVSGHPVADSLLDPAAEASMGHIELAKWADLVLLAPATADLIARVCVGMGNDLLSTLVLATDSPIAVAPAMNQQMYHAQATQDNLNTLKQRDLHIWGPAQGEQACGDVGPGRMLEPMDLVSLCEQFFQPKWLSGKTLTITAGPTREAIDPVRFISNHSSGKMGYALAESAIAMGAQVNLISGPVSLAPPKGVKLISVESAFDMHQASLAYAPNSDVFIGCAAVADYRPAQVAAQKMKKQSSVNNVTIEMVKNPDIIADVATLDDKQRPFTVGFAAETQNVTEYAKQKLTRKKLDLICANDVSNATQGFNSDNNEVHLIWSQGERRLTLKSKQLLAQEILLQLKELI